MVKHWQNKKVTGKSALLQTAKRGWRTKKITETKHILLLTNSGMEPSLKGKVLVKEVEQLTFKLLRIYAQNKHLFKKIFSGTWELNQVGADRSY